MILKYVDVGITFNEVPDEISLCINISNCPCHCKGCHSSYLAEDIGKEIETKDILELINKNKGITCFCFMGGDGNPYLINYFAEQIKVWNNNKIKVAWYSGKQELDKEAICLENFDYIKLGPYIEELGPLNSKTTNQKFYKIEISCKNGTKKYELKDITYKFWK